MSLKRILFFIFYQKRIHKKMIFMINLIIAHIINIVCPKFKLLYSNTWLLGTGDDRYENNIRTFDIYLRNKGEDVIWIVDRKNLAEKIWLDKKVVSQGSIHNYLIALNCYACCFTHGDWDIAPGLFRIKKKHNCVLLYIEHAPSGMKKSKPDMHSRIPADIQCCLSKYERQLKLNEGARPEAARITGFAGYDDYSFRDRKKAIKSILIMPTWRDWDVNGEKTFFSTDLFKTYNQLFNDNRLQSAVVRANVDITFILHPTAARYFDVNREELFSHCKIKVDVITSNDGRMREKIISSDMLITDYSTLCLDFLYMKKNVLCYWYDWREYENKHGLLVTANELQHCVFEDNDSLVDAIVHLIHDAEYISLPPLAEKYFDFYDNNNCERIYNEVLVEHKRF